jgi:multiple sugar transport system permease protein
MARAQAREVDMASLAVAARSRPSASRESGLRAEQRRFVVGSLTPIMALLIFFSLVPTVWVVLLSFFDYTPVRVGGNFLGLGGANPFVGLNNYVGMLAETQPARLFRMAVLNTFVFALLVLPLNLALTLPLALLVESANDRLKGFFRAIYFLPAITSTVAVALMWSYIFNPQAGLLNMILKMVGLVPPKAWLTDPRAVFLGVPLAMIAVIIAYVWQDFGYNLVIFIAALQAIPQDLRDAARVDGANAWHEFWYVILPMLRPVLLFVCVLTMLSSFQVFVPFQLMTNGGPQFQTTPLLMAIYQSGFKYQEMGWAAAISIVLFIIILGFTALQFRLLRTDWEYSP